jgi:hypothetical protein
MALYNVKLTKIDSSHDIVRTNEIVGVAVKLPEIGATFQMLSEPLDTSMGANARYFETSPVQNIFKNDDGTQVIHTTYSIYELEVLSTSVRDTDI